jgi:hypothetical protein
MALTRVESLVAYPEDARDYATILHGDVNENFLAWTSVTFLASRSHFDEDNAYALDIDKLLREDADDYVPKARLDILGDDDAERSALRRGAYKYFGTGARARLRVFGPDVEAAGYCAVLPMSHVSSDVQRKTQTLYAYHDEPLQFAEFDFAPGSSVLVWTGISFVDPYGKFDANTGFAIDVVKIDDEDNDVVWSGGSLLNDSGHPDNLFLGAYVGPAENVRVRIRTFGDNIAVAGYACALSYS